MPIKRNEIFDVTRRMEINIGTYQDPIHLAMNVTIDAQEAIAELFKFVDFDLHEINQEMIKHFADDFAFTVYSGVYDGPNDKQAFKDAARLFWTETRQHWENHADDILEREKRRKQQIEIKFLRKKERYLKKKKDDIKDLKSNKKIRHEKVIAN